MKTKLIILFLTMFSILTAFTPKQKIDMLQSLQQHTFSATRLEDEKQDKLESSRKDNTYTTHGNAKSLMEIRYSDDKDFEKALEKEYSTRINYAGACFDYRIKSIELELAKEKLNSREIQKFGFIKLKYIEDRNLMAIRIDSLNTVFAVEGDLYVSSYLDEYPEQCFVEVTKEYEGHDKWSFFNWKLHYGDHYVPFSTQRNIQPDFSKLKKAIPENPLQKELWEYEHIEYDMTGYEKVFSPSDSLLADYGKNYYALIIGIPEYQYLPSYQYADKDAQDFKDKMQRMLFIPDENIYLSNDSQFPGFDSLMDKFGWLPEHITRDSLKLIVYFAGNGISSDGKATLLYGDYNLYASNNKFVVLDSLLTRLESYQFQSITLFLETSFTSLNNEDMFVTNDLENIPPLVAIPTIAPNINIFYGGNSRGKTSLLADEEHNLFTWALLNSMGEKSDRNRDKYITLNELETRITLLCNNQEEKLGVKQNPRLQTANGNFILFRLDNPYK